MFRQQIVYGEFLIKIETTRSAELESKDGNSRNGINTSSNPSDNWQGGPDLGKKGCPSFPAAAAAALPPPPPPPPVVSSKWKDGVGGWCGGGGRERVRGGGRYHQIAISTKLSLHATDFPSLI